jgi:hypothetical protein
LFNKENVRETDSYFLQFCLSSKDQNDILRSILIVSNYFWPNLKKEEKSRAQTNELLGVWPPRQTPNLVCDHLHFVFLKE